ncbi:MAG: type VII secretion protein EssC [Clostridiales bacterium]
MDLIINIYYLNELIELDTNKVPKEFTIGTELMDDLVVDEYFLNNSKIIIEKIGNEFILKATKSKFLCNGSIMTDKKIEDKDVFLFDRDNKFIISAFKKEKFYNVYTDYCLNTKEEITIGRNQKNNICLKNKQVSSLHAKMLYNSENRKYYIIDIQSKNGIYINNKRRKKVQLETGDKINILNCEFIFQKEYISINNVGSFVEINNLKRYIPGAKHDVIKDKKDKTNDSKYPYFQRPPRFIPHIHTEEIMVEDPPSKVTKPELNWIQILLAPVGMLLGAVVMMVAAGGRSTFIIMSVIMFVTGIFTAIITYLQQSKKFKNDLKLRIETYKNYIVKLRKEIEEKIKIQRKSLWEIHPDSQICYQIVFQRDKRLWERTPVHLDFLNLRLGIGDMNLLPDIIVPKRGVSVEIDDLHLIQQKVHDDYKIVENTPISVNILKDGLVGVIGEKDDTINVAINMIFQMTTMHSYDEVKFVVLFNEKEKLKWKWARWLPHVWDDGHNIRFFAYDKGAASRLFELLDDYIKVKDKKTDDIFSSSKTSISLPYLVFFVSDASLLDKEKISEYILKDNRNIGITSVFLYESIDYLPKDCNTVITIKGKKGEVHKQDNVRYKTKFVLDSIPEDILQKMARKMAPIRIRSLGGDTSIVNSISFFEMYKKNSVEDLDVLNNWKKSESFKSLSVPLGLGPGGKIQDLDIHQKFHGPHGLVAGTTGSGKSEILQSYVLSLAVNFHPHDVVFIIIDYKGGGMANCFDGLPHLIGTITNLGGNETLRALVAIKSEIKRRQAILAQSNLNNSNIDEYQKEYKKGKLKEPLPHLILIVDEFAELKSENPDFMKELVSAARVGRSLGIHLILATQKPSGVVDDQIWSNSKFKLCLKVQDESDSTEVLKQPDAAFIKQPGRAYLQVGNNEMFELFQSAWSGALYSPEEEVQEEVAFVDYYGMRINPNKKKKVIKESETELRAIVDYIESINDKEGIIPIKSPCLPPVPTMISLGELYNNFGKEKGKELEIKIPIGLVDDPANQIQKTLEINLGKEGHLAIYGSPGTGKTTLIQTLTMSLVNKYIPQEVNMYYIDFGGRTLGLFKDLPHVGGVVFADEEEKLLRLFKYLLKTMDNRKREFAEQGVSNIYEYCSVLGKRIPNIILFIDNFSALMEIYPDYDEYIIQFSREGSNVGLHLVMTGNSTMSINFKISVNLKLAIALNMQEKSDYMDIVGQTNGLEPRNVSGRGLIKGKPPLEFQVALPCDGDTEFKRMLEVKKIIDNLSSKYKDHNAKPIPEISEILLYDYLVKDKEVRENLLDKKMRIFLGIDEEEIEPVFFDLDELTHIIITGEPRLGKTNFMMGIILSLAKRNDTDKLKIHIIDSADSQMFSLKNIPHVEKYVNDEESTNNLFSEIKDEVEKRREELTEARISAEDVFDEKDFINQYEKIYIFIDDLNETDGILDYSIKEFMVKLAVKDRNLGVNLIVSGNSNDIGGNYEDYIKSIKDIQCGVYFGNPEDQSIFNIRIPYNMIPKKMDAGDGYSVYRGKYNKIKTPYISDTLLKKLIKEFKD